MAELIKERELVVEEEYSKEWYWKNDPYAGFTFECDANGNIDKDKLCKGALKNLEVIKEEVAKGNLVYEGICRHEREYFKPAVYKCPRCRRHVQIEGDTQCDCGQWFNCFGQELRDDWMDNPSVWDEEIGDLY